MSQASLDYKKNRDKILKLLDECSKFIQLPPEYQGVINWNSMTEDVKKELPKYKDKLPEVINRCVQTLSVSYVNYPSARRGILKCIDDIGTMLEINGVQIGVYEGMVEKVLTAPYYQQYLPGICYKILMILKE